MTIHVTISGEAPMPPTDADFAFKIEFARGEGDPRRVFDAASELIDGFEELDAAVTGSADAKIRSLMVLEEIEAGSLRVWLSSLLKGIDDKGLAEGEIKKAIGPALVQAKYAAIAFLDKDQNTAATQSDELREALRKMAATSDLRQLGDMPPSMRQSSSRL